MDSRESDNMAARPLRRSTRQSSGKVLSFEPTPRGPLKRTRRGLDKKAPLSVVNGSRDEETGSEDEESPSKKSRPETGGDVGGGGDENNEMDVQEPAEDLVKTEHQEMDIIKQDSSHGTHQPNICHDALGDVNLSPRVVLSECWRSCHTMNEPVRVTPSTTGSVTSTKSVAQIRSPATRHDVHVPKVTSMDEYKRTMEAKAKSSGVPTVNHRVPGVYPASEKSYTTRQRVNNIPTQKETVPRKKQVIKKTADIKKSSGRSSRGYMWCFWRLVLLLLLSSSAVLLAYKIIPVLQRAADGREHPSRAVKPEKFAEYLSLLEAQFPSQRPDLWKRSKIHLEKHLNTSHPTEPVSLIFTAGLSAEQTLRCLAQGLASSYSSALNASVLHIDGASKASQDSDEVKLDIDSQLQAAFEGDKPVAVIHRFEELPPGSTLIFYRYCDHENAAYKRVFLLFTVLLPQEEIRLDQSLKEVEEKVHDCVSKRLVASSNPAAYNKMDVDKFSGLWSRISHLTLPVVAETKVEQNGC
ncbi:torsin-1A-interacting protein 2 isoform X1 [Dicentrarchus labrax]|uniref:Torsin-1A-interacting protein 1/2 AAA+ activator domain-containing protein n=1 Tax=Dicentrarchus labrax TaxID=13489 RepID=A0A8P4G9C4_DICLA|nr:torsin-1A-interacting protein 2 isoform X1 [Dicentrarchus labrax]